MIRYISWYLTKLTLLKLKCMSPSLFIYLCALIWNIYSQHIFAFHAFLFIVILHKQRGHMKCPSITKCRALVFQSVPFFGKTCLVCDTLCCTLHTCRAIFLVWLARQQGLAALLHFAKARRCFTVFAVYAVKRECHIHKLMTNTLRLMQDASWICDKNTILLVYEVMEFDTDAFRCKYYRPQKVYTCTSHRSSHNHIAFTFHAESVYKSTKCFMARLNSFSTTTLANHRSSLFLKIILHVRRGLSYICIWKMATLYEFIMWHGSRIELVVNIFERYLTIPTPLW